MAYFGVKLGQYTQVWDLVWLFELAEAKLIS